MAGLGSDPARQAHDTIRGYIYQILRSILVWLDLGDQDQLFLEGAEDLDRIEGTDALIACVTSATPASTNTLGLRDGAQVGAIDEAIETMKREVALNDEVQVAM